MHQILSKLALLMSILQVEGLFFHIRAMERKCFKTETPEDTNLIVNYKVEEYDPTSNNCTRLPKDYELHIEVTDNDDKMFLNRDYPAESRITFTVFREGDTSICLSSKNPNKFKDKWLRVHLDIQVKTSIENPLKDRKMDTMLLRVRQLLDQAEQIKKEQNYQRYREFNFRKISEDIYSSVFFWSLLQVSMLVCIWIFVSARVSQQSVLYGVFCKVIHEKELSKFRTRRAYCILMEIIGPKGQHLSGSDISQWIKQVADSEKAEHFDEGDLISITGRLQSKVKEFTDFLKGPIPVSQNNPTDKHLKANLSLLLATAEQNRGSNIKCNGVLMTCDCKDCTPKEQRKKLDTQV